MDFLRDLMAYLSATCVAAEGKQLFLNSMPSSVNLGIVFIAKFLGSQIDYELPGYRKTSFQVAVRCVNHKEGEDLIKEVIQAITIESEQMVGGHHVKFVRPRSDYVSFPFSAGNNTEFFVNFDAVYVIV